MSQMRLILAMISPVKQSQLLNKEKFHASQDKTSPNSSPKQSIQIDT
jgi:hypothetical protein